MEVCFEVFFDLGIGVIVWGLLDCECGHEWDFSLLFDEDASLDGLMHMLVTWNLFQGGVRFCCFVA